MCRSLLAPVPDDAGRTLDHLPGLPLAVDLAEAGPLAQLHVAVHLNTNVSPGRSGEGRGGGLLP